MNVVSRFDCSLLRLLTTLEHGRLMYEGHSVTFITKMVGNVVGTQGCPFSGGAKVRRHWWLRVHLEGGAVQRDIDLTAKQFYKGLPSLYTGCPESSPLNVSIVGTEEGTDEACGAHVVPTEEYKSRKKVLRAFAQGEGSWSKKMKLIYEKLGMCEQ